MQIHVLIIAVLLLLTATIGSSNAFNNFADIQCGHYTKGTTRKAKIVGGETAEKSEFPWIVSITRRGGHFCGGTIINNKYVITAGHCLCSGIDSDILKPNNIKVTLSQHDLTMKNSDAFQAAIKNVIVHPEYICNKPRNDIAILELEKEIVWSNTVVPACFPMSSNHERHSNFENIVATVAGWGWTHENSAKGGRAKILQKARVNVIENEKCRIWYKSQGKKTKIQETQLCAGYEQGGIDACWADSGGPLMVTTGEKNQLMVVGVVSTGIGCARPQLPGIYTRISEFIPWIEETIGKS